MVSLGELVQIKLLMMMRKETGIVSGVAKLYVYALIVLGSILLLFTGITDVIPPSMKYLEIGLAHLDGSCFTFVVPSYQYIISLLL
jgi:hypothetical protein